MVRGRRPGQREISLETVTEIVKLTQDGKLSRPEIARQVGVSKDTVWRYQKMFGLI